jgi:gamma-glutamylputrescine oxidase
MPEMSSRRRFLKNAAYAGGGPLLGAAGLNQVSPWVWSEPLRFEPNPSFWARSQPSQNPKLTSNLTVDVAVIGGGFTGLSSAYYIRSTSPRKSVVVLEAKGCGNGASGRNGAMVLNMTEDTFMNFSSNPAMDKRIYDLTAGNIRSLAKLSAAMAVDCELATQGALQVFESAEDMRATKAYVEQARSLGMPVEFWNTSQVAGTIGSEIYAGGYFDPNAGQVHPMKLVRVLKAAAASAGANIYENTKVDHIEEGREHLLHTSDGFTIRAKSLVLATNAFTPGLGLLRNSILPLQEFVGITRQFSEQELIDIGWRAPVPFNDSRTEVFYLGLTRDRRIHIGGGAPRYSFNNQTSNASAARDHATRLQRELIRIHPRLSGVEFETTWNGMIDWSLSAAPSVGHTGRYRNIFYGLGYSGHGVNLTSIFGRIIADLEAGREQEWQDYPFFNAHMYYVPNEPFRWLAAEAGVAWYKLTEGSGKG